MGCLPNTTSILYSIHKRSHSRNSVNGPKYNIASDALIGGWGKGVRVFNMHETEQRMKDLVLMSTCHPLFHHPAVNTSNQWRVEVN